MGALQEVRYMIPAQAKINPAKFVFLERFGVDAERKTVRCRDYSMIGGTTVSEAQGKLSRITWT